MWLGWGEREGHSHFALRYASTLDPGPGLGSHPDRRRHISYQAGLAKVSGLAALCLEVKKYKSPEFDVWSQVNFTLDFRTRGGFKVNQHQKLEASAVQS